MIPFARRRFLQQSATVTVGWSASLMLGRTLLAQRPSSSTTRIYLDSRRTLASLDRNLFENVVNGGPARRSPVRPL